MLSDSLNKIQIYLLLKYNPINNFKIKTVKVFWQFSLIFAYFIDLNVGLGQRDHLWEDVGHVKILHLIPLPVGFVVNVCSKGSLGWFSIVDDI